MAAYAERLPGPRLPDQRSSAPKDCASTGTALGLTWPRRTISAKRGKRAMPCVRMPSRSASAVRRAESTARSGARPRRSKAAASVCARTAKGMRVMRALSVMRTSQDAARLQTGRRAGWHRQRPRLPGRAEDHGRGECARRRGWRRSRRRPKRGDGLPCRTRCSRRLAPGESRQWPGRESSCGTGRRGMGICISTRSPSSRSSVKFSTPRLPKPKPGSITMAFGAMPARRAEAILARSSSETMRPMPEAGSGDCVSHC